MGGASGGGDPRRHWDFRIFCEKNAVERVLSSQMINLVLSIGAR
jgi:hypothetical protein